MLRVWAALVFAVTFLAFVILGIWAAGMAAMFAGLGHGSASLTELAVILAVMALLGLGVATALSHAVLHARTIGGRAGRLLRLARENVAPPRQTRDLRCGLCGTRYPSAYYFIDPSAASLVCSRVRRWLRRV